ncbi:dTDP-4-dehydrorhamnose reductase [Bacillus sp. MUM 116]|uniref:sugar nucleotide-binding protein n=1 Tax=Bacillus sp. MUM 116 TaxID=1678002 RepID=UPI0008F5ABD9|nr:sugar nucleotide-binding protein [Bacillus sp. MUM 116]OIK10599.1 dTDP-4-dehydrorhamnose reductase [Bacillus sp. MUM 116]
MEKVLILGASGLVGRALVDELKNGFDVYGTYSSSVSNIPDGKQFQLEVKQTDKLKEVIHVMKPDIVISCLRGDYDHQLKFHKELVEDLRHKDSSLYFLSTTNVFDGDYSRPYTETDLPFSQSDYGNFKIECEKMLREMLAERAIIIRIPAIWGKDSPRYKEIKESIKNQNMIDVYSNLVCNNLLDIQLAKQLRFIIENKLEGTFHLGSVDRMKQGQFYEQIISKLDSEKSLLNYRLFQEKADTFYFALKSNREDIPSSLQITNQDIISYLLG